MPTYEYHCLECGESFDHFQSITSPPLEACPSKGCGGKVERLISGGAGLIFKGTGFYLTDYKNSGTKNSEKKTEKTDAPKEKAGTDKMTTSESKTAAPTSENKSDK